MMKNILFLFTFLITASNLTYASCNPALSLLGKNLSDLREMYHFIYVPKYEKDILDETISLSGEDLCEGEKALENSRVDLLVLNNYLSEIAILKETKKPSMSNWVEATYGVLNKPPSFFINPMSNFIIDKPSYVIFYTIDSKKSMESLVIQSKINQSYFESYHAKLESPIPGVEQ